MTHTPPSRPTPAPAPTSTIFRTTLSTRLRAARRALDRAGDADALVVYDDRGVPVGVVSAAALWADHPATTTVGDVMDFVAVRVAPDAGELTALKAFSAAGWRMLLRRRAPARRAPDPPPSLSLVHDDDLR